MASCNMECNVVLYLLHEQALRASDDARSCTTTGGETEILAVDKVSSDEATVRTYRCIRVSVDRV